MSSNIKSSPKNGKRSANGAGNTTPPAPSLELDTMPHAVPSSKSKPAFAAAPEEDDGSRSVMLDEGAGAPPPKRSEVTQEPGVVVPRIRKMDSVADSDTITPTSGEVDDDVVKPYRRKQAASIVGDGETSSHSGHHSDDEGGEGGRLTARSTSTSASSSSTSSGNTKMARAAGIEDSKIPFIVQVLGAISIPVLCTLALSLFVIIPSASSADYVESRRPFAEAAVGCSNAMIEERVIMTAALGVDETGNKTAAEQYRGVDIPNRRNITEEKCHRLLRLLTKSSDDVMQGVYNDLVIQALKQWERIRADFDNGAYAGRGIITEERIVPIRSIDSIALYVLSDGRASARSIPWGNLYHSREMHNHIGAVRASGTFLLQSKTIARDGWKLSNLWVPYLTALRFLTEISLRDSARLAGVAKYNSLYRVQVLTNIVNLITSGVDPNVTVTYYYDRVTEIMADIELLIVDPMLADATSAVEVKNSVIAPIIIVVISLALSFGAAALVTRAQRQQTANMTTILTHTRHLSSSVARFVPRSFLRLVGAKTITDLNAGDCSEIAVTMLFSDILAFEAISQNMTNVQLFDWLQKYFFHMAEIVKTNSGFIDKFVGDAIFAVFPDCGPAVRCAIGMQVQVDELSVEMIARNEVEMLKIGVGLHHGVVCAGVLGDGMRITGTLVSTDVNLASRLEGLSKQFGAKIVASQAVVDHVGADDFRIRRLGRCRAVGQLKSTVAHEIYQIDSLPVKLHKEETAEKFGTAVELIEAGKVAEGRAILEELVAADPEGRDVALRTILRKVDATSGDIVFEDK